MSSIPQTPSRPKNSASGPSFIPSLRKPSASNQKVSSKTSIHSLSSSTQPSPTPNSAFRSIRNFLPFGQGKQHSQHQQNGEDQGFFSSKKSVSKERRESLQVPLQAPTISIQAEDTLRGSSRRSSLVIPQYDEFGLISEISPKAGSVLSLGSMQSVPARLPSPSLGPDLSTIIEADTSGASLGKHLPENGNESYTTETEDATPSIRLPKNLSPPPLPSPSPSPQRPSPDSPDTLDFGEIAAQVHDALQQTQNNAMVSEWLNETNEADQEESFDLSSLDPDLAQLLSPHAKVAQPLGTQSTPSRRSVSTYIPRPPPALGSGLPRLRPITPVITKTKASPSFEASWEDSGSDVTRRASLDSFPQRRRMIAPPSPLSATSSPRQPEPRLADSLRKSSVSVRLKPHLHPHASASAVDVTLSPRYAKTDLDSYTDVDSADLTQRNRAFIQGAPPSTRSRKRSASVDHRAQLGYSSRTNSPANARASSESTRPTMEWLGPRTAKAFAAAGLLDADREKQLRPRKGNDTSPMSSVARYASVRSMGERGYGGDSQYSPSRSSEDVRSRTGSTVSYRTLGVMESPTLTTSTAPRTTFSGSTAPTSVLSHSPTTDTYEIQQLKDKHQMETEALFSALSDAQRQAKLLREENHQLRARIALLEQEVDSGRKIIDGYRHSMMISPAAPTPRYEGELGTPFRAPSEIQRSWNSSASSQLGAISRTGSLRLETPPIESSFQSAATLQRRRGASTTSTVFPVVPSNMTMLVHENDAAFDISTSSSLPRPQPGNTSPTTINFSMTTTAGSPKSLNLRPEHEEHLGDLDDMSLAENDILRWN